MGNVKRNYELINKRVRIRGSEYNVIDARYGKKYLTLEVSNDHARLASWKVPLHMVKADIKVIGEAKKEIKADRARLDDIKGARRDRSNKKRNAWTKMLMDADARNGDVAMVRMDRGTLKPFDMHRITNSGFFHQAENGRVHYLSSGYVDSIKLGEGERSWRPLRAIGKRKRNEIDLFEYLLQLGEVNAEQLQ